LSALGFFGFGPSRKDTNPTAPSCEEAGWVEAARQGDRRAFDALVAHHAGPLRGFLARRVPASALEDVIQETLLGAWVGLPRFYPEVSFKAWLYRIALNKAADRSRADARRALQETTMGSGEDWWVDTSSDIASMVERKHWVASLLSELPPVQREVIEMYYYAELTLPDIAQLLGRNLNTVKYQFYRAHEIAAQAMEVAARRESEREDVSGSLRAATFGSGLTASPAKAGCKP
jgi:RNA polymerase sigma-70 factor (ECF subfamily)